MYFTINSRKFKPVTFFAQSGGGYVYLDRNGKSTQICYGGSFRGSTVHVRDRESLEREARRWWRAYLAIERNS
jgi:hypothetical protein